MKRKSIIIAICLTSFIKISIAQDIHFSQVMNSPLTLNPASTGVFAGDMRAVLNYKSQWMQVTPNAFKTYAFSFDAGLFKGKWQNGYLGVGVSMFSDKAGDSKYGITQGSLSISSVLNMTEFSKMSAAIQGGFGQRSIDLTPLTWGNQFDGLNYDSSLPTNETFSGSTSKMIPDFSAGVMWNYGRGELYSSSNDAVRANFGVAMYHINQPNQSLIGGNPADKLYSKFVFHGSYFKGIPNTNMSLLPYFAILKQGKSKEIMPGFLVKYNLQDASKYTGSIKGMAVYLGGNYRFGDALVICTQFDIDKYSVGVSYDLNMSGLKTVSKGMGGLEISLKFMNFAPSRNIAKTGHSNTKNM